jgi:ribosomal protein L37E
LHWGDKARFGPVGIGIGMDKTALQAASGCLNVTLHAPLTRNRPAEKSHALLLSTRAKSDVVSEAVLASTVRQGKFRDKEACRRCGAPSVRTFHLLFERVIAPVGGPWSKEKLWDTKFTQYTCRRCGQIYALPRAEASTPRNTPNDAATILRSEQVLLTRYFFAAADAVCASCAHFTRDECSRFRGSSADRQQKHRIVRQARQSGKNFTCRIKASSRTTSETEIVKRTTPPQLRK